MGRSPLWSPASPVTEPIPFPQIALLLVHFGPSLFGWAIWLLTSPLLCLSSQFIGQFEENVPVLRAEVEELRAQIQEPREVVFEDVLLRRPKYVIILPLPHRPPHSGPTEALYSWGRQPDVDGRTLCGEGSLMWMAEPCIIETMREDGLLGRDSDTPGGLLRSSVLPPIRCTPDMDVILNIPVEEPLPF
ncbi:hypothetical protein P7K49_009511 [Saguinus oedipus]|uniref:Uncharacterized protein n=1 Tax=Saguinus oedipus TaxID=9490 RepID=A0ABQ9VKS2_SAGOE|nr:hypothetical protein P7K49_009511 [Saguinus oedipus]